EREVGRRQALEPVDQRRLALLVAGGFGELGLAGRRASALLAHQSLDEAVLAQQSRYADERILDARGRFGANNVGVGGGVEHQRVFVDDLVRTSGRAAGILTPSTSGK